MDVLSDILQTVKLRGTVYFHAHFHSPWGMKIPAGEFANYHIVTNGECFVEIDDENHILLQKGDMVLFPKGGPHAIVDSLKTDAVTASELLDNSRKNNLNEVVIGGDGSHSSSLICGHFEYDSEYPHPLFETLPSFIHISATNNPNATWFTIVSELAAQMSSGKSVGKEAVINRLSESLFIQTLAEYIQTIDDQTTFLAALQNRNIALALSAIHNDISYEWHITELAKIASMSKSVFSSKFLSTVGEPPIIYLARWRMLKAREMLTETTMPINLISEKVGYQSEFSFSKAFKKMTGLSPGAIRKRS